MPFDEDPIQWPYRILLKTQKHHPSTHFFIYLKKTKLLNSHGQNYA